MNFTGLGKTRPLVLMTAALLHLALGLALWNLRPVGGETRPPQRLLAVRLLAARPAAAPAPANPVTIAPRSPDIPPPAPLPAPQIAIAIAATAPLPGVASPAVTAAPAAAASATSAASASLPAVVNAVPLPPPPAPAYQAAALPADHRACSARSVSSLYPAMLRQRGIEGEVVLRVQVDERGRASEVQIQHGSGWRLLDEAARLVAQACPFVPARRGEQTLASWVEYPVRFALSPQLQ